MATYAASRIKLSSGSEGGPAEYKEVGDTVTAKDLGVSDEEFEELKSLNVVTEKPYPKDIGDGESLNAYRQRKLRDGIALADAQGTVAELTEADVKPTKEITETRATHSVRS